jgi:hypothetical protein
MSIWRDAERRLDAIVDGQFGEPVVFYPWTTDSSSGVTDSGGLDTSRSVVKCTAIYVRTGATIIGESGMAHAFGGSTPLLAQDVWVSVSEQQLGDPLVWKEYDRVFFPERNEWYGIAYPAPSATGRPDFHLVRIQAGDVVVPQV